MLFRFCRRFQSQSYRSGNRPFDDGQMSALYGSRSNLHKLTTGKLTVQMKSKIQQDRRENGLAQIVDWDEFCEQACSIPSRSGPVWVGRDDPRITRHIKRQEKMNEKVDQVPRASIKRDAMQELENHQYRAYFTTATNLNDPLSVAEGLYRIGKITQQDMRHYATQIKYVSRPPIVTIMGHVDHGKTTLLDSLRNANVAAGEAGGITQAIGAFSVKVPKSSDGIDSITFIDTPGHEAFGEMRKSGAAATDVIVLVVSITDGIQQQTIEVIDIAKSKGTPLVVAVNKIDRGSNMQPIIDTLGGLGIELESKGGDTLLVPISAKLGTNLPQLLESIQLQAALSELQTPTPSRAEVSIIDSKHKHVTGVVRCGTLKKGQVFVCGMVWGQVTKVLDENGKELKEAGPSTPVVIEGFLVPPKPGNILLEVASKEYASRFHSLMRQVYTAEGENENFLQTLNRESSGQIYNRKNQNVLRAHDRLPLAVTIKAGTFGQLQAILRLIYDLPEVPGTVLKIVQTEVSALCDTDIIQISSQQQPGVFILFGDVKDTTRLGLPDFIEVSRHDVVFHAIDFLKKKVVGLLPKKRIDVIHSNAVCRNVFKASQAKGGNAGGFMVEKGKLHLAAPKMRILRRGDVVWEGNILQLRRFKENVSVVEEGLECGVVLEGSFTIEVGDILQEYSIEFEELDVDAIYKQAAMEQEEAKRRNMRAEEESFATEQPTPEANEKS
eukprot:PhF_6_TR26118/c0_g1_i1/m.36955/K02519/infB, MTIF2; translation initiation factor IF-2